MCGIAAISTNGGPPGTEVLAKMTRALQHRGPDGFGLWSSDDRRVSLGHTRLSIIDLEGGAQPIASEDGMTHIVVNGEFYDFEEIRARLVARGHRLRSASDSEIALHLYEDFGTECLAHLRGEFAFVIWDEKERRIFAARDRFGIKPLYYAVTSLGLLIASEIKALFAGGVEPCWDVDSVYQSLFLTFDQDRTLFRGIRQVPPGCFLTAKGGTSNVRQYWDVDFPKSGDTARLSESEWVDEIRVRLAEAVRTRLRSDVSVGCYLSGGIDSSSVLGFACTEQRASMAAFTVAFEGADFDESAVAQRSAARARARYCSVPVTAQDLADGFENAVAQGEMIHYNGHGVARLALSRAASASGYKVVLAGEGADELFAGYDFSSVALAASESRQLIAPFRVLWRVLRRDTPDESFIRSISPVLARLCKAIGFPETLVKSVAEKMSLIRSFLPASLLAAQHRIDPYARFLSQFDLKKTIEGRDPARQVLYLWLKSLFPNYVLAADRLDMAHGVEVRLPFLDHKLFEFARRIPASLLARGANRKMLLRLAARPEVTEEVFSAVKKPFFAPPSTSKAGSPMRTVVEDLLRAVEFKSLPFFEQRCVTGLLDRFPRMGHAPQDSLDPVLYMLASFAVLQSKYKPSSSF